MWCEACGVRHVVQKPVLCSKWATRPHMRNHNSRDLKPGEITDLGDLKTGEITD